MRKLGLVVAALWLAAPVGARTLRVAKDGSGDFKKLADALEAAKSGDEVVVADLGRLGVEIKSAPGGLVIERVVAGAAADKAGLNAGDVIVLIDDRDAAKLTLQDAFQRLVGPAGSSVRLHVQRAGQGDAKPVEVVRAPLSATITDDHSRLMLAASAVDWDAMATFAKKAAKNGDAYASYVLAQAYMSGQGVRKSEGEAIRFLKLAADGGEWRAQAWYGSLLVSGGHLVKQDRVSAARHLRAAAAHDDPESLRMLGWLYAWGGDGVPRDRVEAEKLYRKAIALGTGQAQGDLDALLKDEAAQKAPEALTSAKPVPEGPVGLTRTDIQQLMREAFKEQQRESGKAAARAAPKASGVDAPTYARKERPDDLAVVIGIEKYASLPEASFAERDAQAVRAHLVALGYPERNIFSLTGAQATKSAFIKELEARLKRLAKPDSNVFVYYSGHGAPDPKSGDAYLVPYDGDPEFLDETAYPVKRLYAKLGALGAKRVVVSLDSCFSGAGGRSVLAKGARPLVTKAASAAPAGKVAALTAASGGEISGALDEEGHGLFTYFLLKGLNDGQTTLAGLARYVKPKVADEARRHNRDQTPQLFGDAELGR